MEFTEVMDEGDNQARSGIVPQCTVGAVVTDLMSLASSDTRFAK